ncbi:MAG: hypothetical protein ACE5KG_02520, partial [Nitrososphaerales archaeon]
MVERYLSLAIALMVFRQIQVLIAWGMDFFRPLGDVVVAINVIDPISLAIITPLVVIGGKRILLGAALVNVVWFAIGMFGSLQFLTGA